MQVPLVNPYNQKKLQEGTEELYDDGGEKFTRVKGVYRIVKNDNYAESFGFQWNKFERTQVDKFSKSDLTSERFFKTSGWSPESLKGLNMLEVGSGAGRFTSVILANTEVNLYSVDYSNAVEANYRNNGPNKRLQLFQASIYEMPFQKESFDRVFCFGVLQHTPDFKKSVFSLTEMVKPGGELAVDFYPVNGWWTKINAKYILRPITKNMNQEKLLKMIEKNVGWMIATARFLDKIKLGFLSRFLPLCDLKASVPAGLPENLFREWVILDTFDMFSPAHDHPQKISTVKKWFEEAGMKNVWAGYVEYYPGFKAAVVRGKK